MFDVGAGGCDAEVPAGWEWLEHAAKVGIRSATARGYAPRFRASPCRKPAVRRRCTIADAVGSPTRIPIDQWIAQPTGTVREALGNVRQYGSAPGAGRRY